MMTLKEIKKAVNQGKQVRWVSDIYHVLKDNNDNYYIKCVLNQNIIGLTHKSNKKLWMSVSINGKENDFYIKGGV